MEITVDNLQGLGFTLFRNHLFSKELRKISKNPSTFISIKKDLYTQNEDNSWNVSCYR